MIHRQPQPPEYNGLRWGSGRPTFHGRTSRRCAKVVEKGDFVKRQGDDARVGHHHGRISTSVRQDISVGRKGMKIVIDAGNGVGGHIAVPLFRSMGFEVIPALLRDGLALPEPPSGSRRW